MSTDPKTMVEWLQRDRYHNRRRIAWLSWACIFLVGTGVLVFGLSNDDRAARVSDLSFLLGSLLGVWTTVVAAYYGVTAITDNTEIRVSAQGYTQDSTRIVRQPAEAPPPVQPPTYANLEVPPRMGPPV